MGEPQTKPAPRGRIGSPWHWLLFIPVVVPLLTFLFNSKNPYVLGFPRFYWLQLVFIALSVATTLVVYRLTGSGRRAGPVPGGPHAGGRSDEQEAGR